jgi:hypothetical protein
MFNPGNPSFNLSPVNHYNFAFDTQRAIAIAGCKVLINGEGQIWCAQYASGAEVRINETYSVSRNVDHSLMFGDQNGGFHPLD